MSAVDFDGDGETDEGLQGEVKSLHDALYVAMQEYSAAEVGSTILYDAHSYPYFFNDTNDNSELDEEEVDRANGFNTWTPRLLRAAYNYQFAMKDPGAFAHNGPYISASVV